LTASTLADGTGAAEASVTAPVRVPYKTWAQLLGARATIRAMTKTQKDRSGNLYDED
jgi:hypothetical protein